MGVTLITGGIPDPTGMAGMQAWWRADQQVYTDAGSTLATDGQTVQQWNDTSGNGRNLSQGTAGARPTYKESILGGKPVVRFGGGSDDDYMQGSALSNFFAVGAKTAFIVANNNQNNQHALLGGEAADQFFVNYATSGTIVQAFNNDSGGLDGVTDSGLTLGVYYIVTAMHDGTSVYVSASDTRTASLASTASGNTTALTSLINIGRRSAANPFMLDGDIAEVLLFNVALSEDNRKLVEKYLAFKYSLTIPY